MMRSRVSTQIDMGLLSEGLSRPGIDPRIWVSYGVLQSEPYIETIEGRQDILVDVMLMPSGAEETARVGAIYAGNGFGLYAPLHMDDEVLVLAPSGDPDEGLVIAQRLWSPADPPPAAVSEHPEDVTLVVETGKNLRLNVLGQGNIILQVDTGKIYLGAPEGTEPAAKGSTLKGYLESVVSAFGTHVHTSAAAGSPTTPPLAGLPAPTDALLATTTEVK